MSKITKEDFNKMYTKYSGCQEKLANHYNLSTRSIRNYKSRYIKPVENVPKEELVNLYIDKRKSITSIATHFKVSRHTIYKKIEEYNISRDSKYCIEQIKKAYEVDNFNIKQLMEISGIKSRDSLHALLKKHNITNKLKNDITDLYVAHLSTSDIAKKLEVSIKDVEFNLRHHSIYRQKLVNIDKDELKEQRNIYTLEQLAERYKCSSRTISEFIKKYELDKKDNIKYTFDYKTIYDQYVIQELTMDEIADKYNCCRKTVNNFIRDNNIDHTNKRVNSYERAIKLFLETNSIKFKHNTREIISPKELDFYLPEHNIAIEVCGLYWHSTQINKDKYHINDKYKQCKELGIQLITIFEDELLSKREIVYNRLRSILKLSPAEIYARQCYIKPINSRQGIDFLNANHLQGSGRNTMYIGAFYRDDLVAVMSFAKPNVSKGQAKTQWELNRFASIDNIPGVASKLFKFFERQYNPETVVSYADLRWSNGALYKQLGFVYSHTSKPNYWYVIRQTRKHRFNYTKQKLLDKYLNEDPKQTEEQIAENNNLYRIYDCGNAVYFYKG